ncbi:LytR family transcriptional regulator [Massilia sp. Root133]|uniref:Response regulator n=1 Tax=Massilia cellulosiltytica TaxID=2683234 RepID=A0A7X3K830_9BURK|nr:MULTISPECIES: response regulator [Telluria group]KQY11994.1 LytR family transcriptional regulator [Massilia sp. Root133]KQZ34541.1 LytR family transcriptional regulator [Massilia sp. Root1485]MVW60556.1 response regulator [Telluria cellulosilytica]
MRVIIVDDEPLARAVLREHLGLHPDVEIVGECANGFEAVKAIAELAPDLVFLDIQMPKLDGFEVVELAGAKTHYVFVTAYDQFALRAFDVHALDYLLKPFTRERLAQALAHARERVAAPATEGEAAMRALVTDARARHQPIERVLIRDGARVQVIPVARIDYIEAQDDYVAICSEGRQWLKNQRMAELESQLDPHAFLRVHRSYIVNLGTIARIEPTGKDGHCAVLKSGARVPISRSGYQKVRDLMR